jgi:voltage-gated potassium channel
MGRFISMLSSLFGVAIIALPSGVITASYLDELRHQKNEEEEKEEES